MLGQQQQGLGAHSLQQLREELATTIQQLRFKEEEASLDSNAGKLKCSKADVAGTGLRQQTMHLPSCWNAIEGSSRGWALKFCSSCVRSWPPPFSSCASRLETLCWTTMLQSSSAAKLLWQSLDCDRPDHASAKLLQVNRRQQQGLGAHSLQQLHEELATTIQQLRFKEEEACSDHDAARLKSFGIEPRRWPLDMRAPHASARSLAICGPL